eukprot:6209501-Pleurochrysis_carterae.AAC.3
MYRLAILPVHNSFETPIFLHAGTRFGKPCSNPSLVLLDSQSYRSQRGAQARLDAMKATPNPLEVAEEASADAAWEGMGLAGHTSASDREGVAPGTHPILAEVIDEGSPPKI